MTRRPASLGERPDLLRVLADARVRGFLGPGPVERQVVHAEDLATALGPFSGTFLDLGSGGGLPGLVLARRWEQAHGSLLDAQQKRCGFLRSAVSSLELGERVDVQCGRAETLARLPALRSRFDLVVARAFGAPAVVAECAVGFLASGGRLVVTEPPGTGGARAGLGRWPTSGISRLGFAEPAWVGHRETGAVVMRLEGEPDERWPRRDGVPAKRPLW